LGNDYLSLSVDPLFFYLDKETILQQGNTRHAYKWAKEMLKMNPNHERMIKNSNYFRRKMEEEEEHLKV